MSSRLPARTPLALLVLALGTVVAQQPPAPLVSYTEATRHPVRRVVRLPGSVESRTASIVASEVEGLVRRLDAVEGQRVARGEPLARLNAVNFELELRAAEGGLKEARARLELAESKLTRARELFAEGVISQDELDDAVSESTAWQGRVDQTLAQIEKLKVDIRRCVIRAPFSGAVVEKRTDVGQWINEGGAVFAMISVEKLEVRVEVPERYYAEISPAADAQVSFEALPGWQLTGRVQSVIPQADPQARTFPIKVRIDNREGRVGAGMLAEVALPVGQVYEAVVVPKDALVRRGPQLFVYRITPDQVVEPVPVTSGQGVGAWIAVEGPLAEGQPVVTRGNERLRPGQSVRGEALEYPLP